uniref:ribosomal protein S18 n=1 Tax=Prototheca fontanea TaxID=2836215 RepID=UPI003000FE09
MKYDKNLKKLSSVLNNKKSNYFPLDKYNIDYKNTVLLKNFLSSEGKILPKKLTNITSKQQRNIAKAIKRSRMSILNIFQKPSKKKIIKTKYYKQNTQDFIKTYILK